MANGQKLRERAQAQAAQRKAQAAGQPPEEKQPGTEVAMVRTADVNAYELLDSWRPQLEQALARQVDVDHFLRMAAINIAASKQAKALAQCSRPSLYNAIAQCAHYGLLPDGIHAAIVPFREGWGENQTYVATFIPMYQGFVQLAFNTGQVASVTARLVYRRDEWAEELGPAGRGFIHKPLRFDAEGFEVLRGRSDIEGKPPAADQPGADNPPILAYCYATFRDGTSTAVEVVSRQEAIEVRDKYSKAYRSAEQSWNQKPPRRDSPWHTNFDEQWLKTAVRRGMKYIPKSAALVELLLADNAADSTIRGQVQPWQPPPVEGFQPGGPAAAWEGDVTYGQPGKVADGEVLTDDWEHATPAGQQEEKPAAGQQEEKPPRPRRTAMQHLNACFADAGWAGRSEEAKQVRREVIAAILTPGGAEFPVEIGSAADLPDADLDRAALALASVLRELGEKNADAHEHLGDVAAKVSAARAKAAAQTPADGAA